jgi:hypothetical protein
MGGIYPLLGGGEKEFMMATEGLSATYWRF